MRVNFLFATNGILRGMRTRKQSPFAAVGLIAEVLSAKCVCGARAFEAFFSVRSFCVVLFASC